MPNLSSNLRPLNEVGFNSVSIEGDDIEEMLAGGVDTDDLIEAGKLDDESPTEHRTVAAPRKRTLSDVELSELANTAQVDF